MGRSIKTARSIDLITNLANVGKAVAAEQDNAESMMSTLLSDTAKELLERQRKNELHYGKELKCEVTIDCDSADFYPESDTQASGGIYGDSQHRRKPGIKR